MDEEEYRQAIERNSQGFRLMRKLIFRESQNVTDETLKISLNQFSESAKQSTARIEDNFVRKPASFM
jgi:hypothetical protein